MKNLHKAARRKIEKLEGGSDESRQRHIQDAVRRATIRVAVKQSAIPENGVKKFGELIIKGEKYGK